MAMSATASVGYIVRKRASEVGVVDTEKKATRRCSSQFAMNEHKVVEEKLVIVMVGLPARGKSYISKALVRYLNFLGCNTRLFNAGNLRRLEGKAGITAEFFDPTNTEAKLQREQMAMACLEELLDFLDEAGECSAVGILDATNTTVERRAKVQQRCNKVRGVQVLFLESLCTDESVLKVNYQLKLENEDYQGMQVEEAALDFQERVRVYESAYEPVQDEEAGEPRRYVKLIDAGRKMIKYRCESDARTTLIGHVMTLMHSIHLGPRSIFLALIGQSKNSVYGRLGGDRDLTEAGQHRAVALARFLADQEAQDNQPALVMCGTLQRHLQTARYLTVASGLKPTRTRTVLKLQRLNELCVGSLDNMTVQDIISRYPDEATARRRDKLNYRYPGEGGESYQDLVLRLHESILRLEQLRGSAMVLCDRAVMRVLLGYFRGTPVSEIPYLEVPTGVVRLTRSHRGFQETHIDILPGQEVVPVKSNGT